MYQPTLSWMDRYGQFSNLQSHAKRNAEDYVKQSVEEFLEHAGIIAVGPVKVMDHTCVHHCEERPIRAIQVFDSGKKIRLFSYGSPISHHGVVVLIESATQVEQRDLISKKVSFNARYVQPAPAQGRSQKPPYRNGGAMKTAYISGK